MKVKGYRWNWNAINEQKREFYGGIIKTCDNEQRRYLIQFDNGDDDALIWYDLLSKSVNRDTLTFDSFNLPANPITHAKEEINHHNGKFVMDKLNWTEISEDTNYPEIPDITLIEYRREREEFDVNITNKELNNTKDSNGTIQFMNVMQWCLPWFDNGEINLFTLRGKHKEWVIITYTIY